MVDDTLATLEPVTLEILPLERGLTVRLECQDGSQNARFGADWDNAAIRHQLELLDDAMLRCIIEHYGSDQPSQTAPEQRDHIVRVLTQIGEALFGALVPSDLRETFAGRWRELVEGGRTHADGLRLRLRLDPTLPELAPLAALPWETLLWRRGPLSDSPARLRHAPLVRCFGNRRANRPLPVDGPLKVLLVESSPRDSCEVAIAKKLREALVDDQVPVPLRPALDIDLWRQPHFSELRDTLIEGRYHALFFIGHGAFEGESNFGALSFVHPETKKGQAIPGYLVGENLKDLSHLRLVVLMSCSSGALDRHEEKSPFVNVAPALLAEGVPTVVAMQFPISPAAAYLFSRAFLVSLRRGEPVDVATVEGRVALYNKPETRFEWATPAVFSRVDDPRIFAPAGDDTSPPETSEASGSMPSEPVHVGIRTFVGGWGQEIAQRSDHLLDLDQYFDSSPGSRHRIILDSTSWDHEIRPRVERFLESVVSARPLVLDMAAHLSIAFWAGRVLESKAGLAVTVIQRTQDGTLRWRPRQGPVPDGPLWCFESLRLNDERDQLTTADTDPPPAGRHDVAVAVSVTHDVLEDVQDHLRVTNTPVSRILHARIAPETGQGSVASGAHALRLSHELSRAIQRRSATERQGVLHLFIAAPNVLTWLLGQQSKVFGAIQLYEHDRESGRTGAAGAYQRSMRIVPPRWQGAS